MNERQKDALINLGIELSIIVGQALLGELRKRYFQKNPSEKWVFDENAVTIEENNNQ